MKSHAYSYTFYTTNDLPRTLADLYSSTVSAWDSHTMTRAGPNTRLQLSRPLHLVQAHPKDDDPQIIEFSYNLGSSIDILRFDASLHPSCKSPSRFTKSLTSILSFGMSTRPLPVNSMVLLHLLPRLHPWPYLRYISTPYHWAFQPFRPLRQGKRNDSTVRTLLGRRRGQDYFTSPPNRY